MRDLLLLPKTDVGHWRCANSPERKLAGFAPDDQKPPAPSSTSLLDPSLDQDERDDTDESEPLTPDTAPPPPDDLPPGDDDNDDDHGGPHRWVTVATFTSPTEAQVARLKLESEEIDCFLDNENLIAMDWLFSNAVGGVKLKVPEPDAERAHQILASRAAPAAASADPVYDGQLRCPRCGSADITRDRFNRRWAFLSILFLGIPVPIAAKGMRCTECGATWE